MTWSKAFRFFKKKRETTRNGQNTERKFIIFLKVLFYMLTKKYCEQWVYFHVFNSHWMRWNKPMAKILLNSLRVWRQAQKPQITMTSFALFIQKNSLCFSQLHSSLNFVQQLNHIVFWQFSFSGSKIAQIIIIEHNRLASGELLSNDRRAVGFVSD